MDEKPRGWEGGSMSSRPKRRVPPPPPPGFGDEEYYKLYGKPEEYQKYRSHTVLTSFSPQFQLFVRSRVDVPEFYHLAGRYSRQFPAFILHVFVSIA